MFAVHVLCIALCYSALKVQHTFSALFHIENCVRSTMT